MTTSAPRGVRFRRGRGSVDPLASCAVCLALLVGSAGCGRTDGADGDRAVVRDSAGIEVVENPRDVRWPGSRAWTVADSPTMQVGSVGGEDRLFSVEDAVRLSDGGVVVANAGTAELLLFGPEGGFRRAVGGEGGGPGEFSGTGRALSDLAATSGDTLLAYDVWAHRVSIFGPAGGFVRSVPLEIPESAVGGLVIPAGWLVDRSFVARAAVASGGSPPGLDGSRRRPDERVLLFGPGGEVVESLGVFPGRESRMVSPGSNPGAGESFAVRSAEVPFRKTLAVHAGADRVAVAPSDRYEIRLYGRDGALRRIVRRKAPPAAVGEREREAWIDHRIAEVEDAAARRRTRRDLADVEFPRRMPAFGAVRLDAGGHLWVKDFRPPSRRTGPAAWSVFDERGRLMGEVEMPAGLEPFEIGRDYVLGVREGGLEVERVQVHRLRKPAPGAR